MTAGPRTPCCPLLTEVGITFELLSRLPSPLGLHGAVFPPNLGLPDRFLPLRDLPEVLAAATGGALLRQAVWAAVIERAAGPDPAWRVAAVHLAAGEIGRRASVLAGPDAGSVWSAQAAVIAALLRSIDAGTAIDVDWLA